MKQAASDDGEEESERRRLSVRVCVVFDTEILVGGTLMDAVEFADERCMRWDYPAAIVLNGGKVVPSPVLDQQLKAGDIVELVAPYPH
jgi:sulfur carrier protein ThiS